MKNRAPKTNRSRSRAAAIALAGACALSPTAFAQDSFESLLELLEGDDVRIALATLQATDTVANWEITATGSLADYSIDFEPAPFDLFGEARQLDHTSRSLTVSGERRLSDELTLQLSTALRDGFANFRTVWLDTYFDQHFSPLEGVPGHELYQNFQPSAASVSSSLSWEYVPANAKATVTVSRIQDNVSPGYEIDFDGVQRSELVLASTSLSATTENVLTPWLRSRIIVSATETSSRENRYAGEFALNAALGEKTTLRTRIGGSKEAPLFEASLSELTAIYQLTNAFSLSATARRYHDTGEIENALLFTTAAPELQNDSLGASLSYRTESWSARFDISYSESDYAETNANTDFFQNLYADRDWTLYRVAFAKQF